MTIDRGSYLPQSWAQDQDRRREHLGGGEVHQQAAARTDVDQPCDRRMSAARLVHGLEPVGGEEFGEESVEESRGSDADRHPMSAEPVDLVAGKLEFTVTANHWCVPLRIGSPFIVGAVLDAFELDDDAAAL